MIGLSTRCRNWRAGSQSDWKQMGKRRNLPQANGAQKPELHEQRLASSGMPIATKKSSDSNKKTIHMFATIWPGDSDQSELSWQKNGLLWPSCPMAVVSLQSGLLPVAFHGLLQSSPRIQCQQRCFLQRLDHQRCFLHSSPRGFLHSSPRGFLHPSPRQKVM